MVFPNSIIGPVLEAKLWGRTRDTSRAKEARSRLVNGVLADSCHGCLEASEGRSGGELHELHYIATSFYHNKAAECIFRISYRRKFGSQTSGNVDTCQRGEEKKKEDQRRESQKKEDASAKRYQSRETLLFH